MTSGTIYYIVCSETGRVKIGFTSGNAEKRLSSLQTGCPTDLVVLAVHRGSLEDERELHQRFAEYRIRGEWFEPSAPIIQHIGTVVWLTAKEALATGREVDNRTRTALRQMHEQSPLPADLAAIL